MLIAGAEATFPEGRVCADLPKFATMRGVNPLVREGQAPPEAARVTPKGNESGDRYAERPREPGVYRGGLPRFRLKRVIDYIDENVSGDLALAQLAAVAGMSPHYFAELFRQSTGRAPHQYVLMRRINLAKERLRDPRRSVIDVGLDAGFENPSHFARVFRKWVGTSPSDFRAGRRGAG